MPKILQIDYPFNGPFGDDIAEIFHELAVGIAKEPGLIWKIWTEDATGLEAGGIYLFEDEASAKAYLEKHTARLKVFGVTIFRAKILDVNEHLTKVTKGPIHLPGDDPHITMIR